MRKLLIVSTALCLAGCQPSDLERQSSANIKILADCIFPKIVGAHHWLREDLYDQGFVRLTLAEEEVQTITISAVAGGSKIVAKFPKKATGHDSQALDQVFGACGARAAI